MFFPFSLCLTVLLSDYQVKLEGCGGSCGLENGWDYDCGLWCWSVLGGDFKWTATTPIWGCIGGMAVFRAGGKRDPINLSPLLGH